MMHAKATTDYEEEMSFKRPEITRIDVYPHCLDPIYWIVPFVSSAFQSLGPSGFIFNSKAPALKYTCGTHQQFVLPVLLVAWTALGKVGKVRVRLKNNLQAPKGNARHANIAFITLCVPVLLAARMTAPTHKQSMQKS